MSTQTILDQVQISHSNLVSTSIAAVSRISPAMLSSILASSIITAQRNLICHATMIWPGTSDVATYVSRPRADVNQNDIGKMEDQIPYIK